MNHDQQARKLRLIFMGTPDFSVPCLAALADAGHEIVAVYSQPPRKSGRGHKVQPSPVHAFADANGWPVHTPTNLKTPEALETFESHNADVAIVVAYGLILPVAILDAPKNGCLNIHASLLPRWRGAAPIQRAIEAGDCETGVCIMQMDRGLDTGAVISRLTHKISDDETGQSLHDTLSAMGANQIVQALEQSAPWPADPQSEEGVTYASKLDKAESKIDWSQPADVLERRIRAFTPWPGTWCDWQGQRLKIVAAEAAPGNGGSGTVLDNQLLIACGQGALRLTKVQRQGKGPITAVEFLRGSTLPQGSILG